MGDALCAKILTPKGSIINRTSYFRLSAEDNNSKVIKKRKAEWDQTLKANLIKKGKKWEAMDPGEDDTPSHLNQSNESDNDPMYGAELKELTMDNVDKLLKKETPKVH